MNAEKTGEQKVCDCACHDENKTIRHCIPCCEFTHDKYLSKGRFNRALFEAVYREKYGNLPVLIFNHNTWHYKSTG